MYLRLFSTIFPLIILCACNKSDNLNNAFSNLETIWTIGADHSSDTLVMVPNSRSGQAELEIKDYSVCPNVQVHLEISTDRGDFILEENTAAVATYKFDIPEKAKELKITTTLIDHQTNIYCVWLGKAKIIYRYSR